MSKLISKKLIVESEFKNYEVVTEASPTGAKLIKLKGIFMEAETLNNNERKYHLEEMVEECKKFQGMIEGGRALAELEHPEEVFINPDRVCARILKLEQSQEDENQFLGEAVVMAADPSHGVLGTPCGTILGSMLQYGTKVGWSTRGLGTLNPDGYVDEFQLVTIDCVLDPSIGKFADTTSESTSNKFVHGVLESRQFLVDTYGEIVEAQTKILNEEIKHLPKNSLLKELKLRAAVDKYLKSIC